MSDNAGISVALILIFLLIILTVGEPDLLDAIRHRIDPVPCTCPEGGK